MKKLLTPLLLLLLSNTLTAQILLTTESGTNFSGYFGISSGTPPTPRGAVSFVIENNNHTPMLLRQVDMFRYSYFGTINANFKLWYSATSLSDTATIAAPVWAVIDSTPNSTVPVSTYYPIFTSMAFTIPAHTQYRFVVECSNGIAATDSSYHPTPNTFSSRGVTLKVHDALINGSFVGYKGSGGGVSGTSLLTRLLSGPAAFTGRVHLSCQNSTPAAAPTVNGNKVLCDTALTATLAVTAGNLQTANYWQWYADSCGGSHLLDTGTTITVHPANTTTYYVRGEGGCAAALGSCTPLTVTIGQPPITTLTTNRNKLLPGITATLQANSNTTATYSWYKDGAILNGNNSNYTATAQGLGTYYVQAMDANGCVGNSNAITLTDSVTAQLFIYPNPNNGQFTVSYYSSTPQQRTIVIYDVLGRQVKRQQFMVTQPYQAMRFTLNDVQSGVYIVYLLDSTGNKIATGKLVIE